MDRLSFLSVMPEGPVPQIAAGPVNEIPIGEPAAFLKALRDYGNEKVDREFMDDRKDVWNMHARQVHDEQAFAHVLEAS